MNIVRVAFVVFLLSCALTVSGCRSTCQKNCDCACTAATENVSSGNMEKEAGTASMDAEDSYIK